jgi:hypothetical protein
MMYLLEVYISINNTFKYMAEMHNYLFIISTSLFMQIETLNEIVCHKFFQDFVCTSRSVTAILCK